MSRKLFFIGVIFILLLTAAATPFSVRAEGDPPPNPEPVKPPWITGINPNVSLSTEGSEELTPGGVADLAAGVEVPLLAAPPEYVDLVPQESVDASLNMDFLAVPQRYQNPLDNTCGAAALGMALEFLSLNGEGDAPSQAALVADLENSGLLYKTGTGVEELAFLARQHGYQGTNAFHDWTLAQLKEQLEVGTPVVVSLGSNGEEQAGHFVTLTGISADGKWVSYNDPILGKQTVAADEFQKLWDLQGNAGLVARKEPLSVVNDPMLPWMGLFSAMAALAVIAKQYPLGSELTSTLENIRNILSNPLRKGLAGKLIAEGGSNSAPPYLAPPGYHWTKTSVPKYGWKEYQIVEKVQVPNIVKTYGVIKTNTRIEKIPVYTTVKVDKGHWAYRTVKKYRTERYRTKERYRVKKTYWYRRGYRLYRGTRYEWKTRTVVKTRKVPYYTRQRYWVPKIVTEKKLVRVREVVHRDPVYGWKEEVRGTRTVEKIKTTRAWAPVGTKIDWKLKKDPVPTPTPTPYPTPTPSPERAPDPPVSTPTPPNQLAASEPGLLAKITDPLWWKEKAREYGEKVQDQKVFSVSASDHWDINMYSQAGVIAQSTPYNMFYVNQMLDVGYKEKLTGNPGSFADVDVTSGTMTVNMTENLSVFGSINGGTAGYGVKRPGGVAHNYIVDKVSIGLTPQGPTITYRQEGVNRQLKNEEENFELKGVTTIACNTYTLRTEGLVLIGGVIVLAVLAGPEILALGPPVLEGLNRLIPNLIPAFGN